MLKVLLAESSTICLFETDGNSFITESSEIPGENKIELIDLIPNTRGKFKCTQTLTALNISEKEQTLPIDLKVPFSPSFV